MVGFLIVNLIVFLLICAGLFYLQKKHISFTKRVFAALFIGIAFGFAIHFIYGETSWVTEHSMMWVNMVGDGFVRLLKMLIIPLVFFAILSAFTNTNLSNNFGKIGGTVVGLLAGTAGIAAAVAIAFSLLFNLGDMQLEKGDEEASTQQFVDQKSDEFADMTFPEKIVSFIPSNAFEDMTGSRSTSTIAVVIFSAILGMAFIGVKRKEPEQAELFAKMVNAVFRVIMRVVTLVLRITPYGVLALIANKAATNDLNAFINLGKFVLVCYISLFAMFLVHLLLIRITGLNPWQFVKKSMPALTFGFTSRSSAGTLPINLDIQKKRLGVSEGVADVSGAFGLTIGQNGCAGVYPAMVAVMAASTAGINPAEPLFILALIGAVMISSFGVAGVGGGGIFASIMVLGTMNLPVAIIGLLISIEPLVDMGRTALNVSDAMTTGVLTSRFVKEHDRNVYDKDTSDEIISGASVDL